MSQPLLACRGLDVRVGGRCLVQALDLDVDAGQRWALVGPNGAGKTSLLLVLAGARRPDAGTVVIGGRALADWNVEELAGLRAMVADRWIDPFATSVLDTVAAARYRLHGAAPADGTGASAEVARRCLAEMDCAALADRDVRYLSRGERQRVALATALAQETALVLLDEPISHQDPRHQIQVLRALRARATCTYIGALHDINAAARFATHALLLYGDGRWRAGPADAVLTRDQLSPLFDTSITEVAIGTHRVFLSLN
jgi:iron complex transport system ATP-binding protein